MTRFGMGYDVHRLTEGRRLILGGVEVPHALGLLGHSDADVLLHALSDALLGAAALGDIGQHFPDTDPTYEGADSLVLLARVMELLGEKGYIVGNADCTIVAQRPKLKDYLPEMQENIARTLGVTLGDVNVKATTEERLGFTGREEGFARISASFLNVTLRQRALSKFSFATRDFMRSGCIASRMHFIGVVGCSFRASYRISGAF